MDILVNPSNLDGSVIHARWDRHSPLCAVGTITVHDQAPAYRIHMKDGAELRCYTRDWMFAVVRTYLKTHTSLLVIDLPSQDVTIPAYDYDFTDDDQRVIARMGEGKSARLDDTDTRGLPDLGQQLSYHNALHAMFQRRMAAEKAREEENKAIDEVIDQIIFDFTRGQRA